jgi:hypothetical protein
MKVGRGTEAAQFLFWEFSVQCMPNGAVVYLQMYLHSGIAQLISKLTKNTKRRILQVAFVLPIFEVPSLREAILLVCHINMKK